MDSDSDIEIVPFKPQNPAPAVRRGTVANRVISNSSYSKLPSLSPPPELNIGKPAAEDAENSNSSRESNLIDPRRKKSTGESSHLHLQLDSPAQSPQSVHYSDRNEVDRPLRKSCENSRQTAHESQPGAIINLASSPFSAFDSLSDSSLPSLSNAPKNKSYNQRRPFSVESIGQLGASPIPKRAKSKSKDPSRPNSSCELSDPDLLSPVPGSSAMPRSQDALNTSSQKNAREASARPQKKTGSDRAGACPSGELVELGESWLQSCYSSQNSIPSLNSLIKGKSKAVPGDPTPESPTGNSIEHDAFNQCDIDPETLPHVPLPNLSTDPVPLNPYSNSAPQSKSALSRIEKQAKAAEARSAREAKKAAKEAERLQHRLMREANKLSLNRKETVSEVRMWVPQSIKKSKLHPLTKALEVLEERISSSEGCAMHKPGEIDDDDSEPRGVIRWIRTTNKEWNEEQGIFIPLGVGQTKESSEPTVLVVWTGKEVDETIASGPNQLMNKARAIKAHYPQDQLFIVISGLETILRAEKKRDDAAITNEARARLASQLNEPDYLSSSKYTNRLPKSSRDKILKELEILKISTKAFVIRVEDKNEFANWLWEMTLEIGVRPYKSRKQELKSALRLEISGSKGTNHEDTYIKMLSSLTRVTENEAKGIVSKFPTLKILYNSWERGIEQHGLQWAEEMLIGCSKSNSITGTNANRKIGKVTSKRIFDIMYKVKNGDACL